ncbi:hypothetical protein [Ralstonia pseudosolanacearum]
MSAFIDARKTACQTSRCHAAQEAKQDRMRKSENDRQEIFNISAPTAQNLHDTTHGKRTGRNIAKPPGTFP